MCVLQSKVDRVVLGPRRERSDPHQVQRLHTNMKRHKLTATAVGRRRQYMCIYIYIYIGAVWRSIVTLNTSFNNKIKKHKQKFDMF